jgi:hypothetical protein
MTTKCKVVEIFQTSVNTVAVVEFSKGPYFKVGDKLRNSKGLLWLITRITKVKPLDQSFESLKRALEYWDCTIDAVNHNSVPIIGEELTLVKE